MKGRAADFRRASKTMKIIFSLLLPLSCNTATDSSTNELPPMKVAESAISNEEPSLENTEIYELSNLVGNPEDFAEQCRTAKSAAVKERCERIERRPHLFQKPARNKSHSEPPPGKRENLSSGGMDLADVPPSTSLCGPEENQSVCRENKGLEASSVEGAAAECLALQSRVWRAECFFYTAENRLMRGTSVYAEAGALCSMSGNYRNKCFQHLSIVLADRNHQGWKKSKELSQEITDFWEEKNPESGQAFTETFWFTHLAHFFSRAKVLDRSAFQALPENVHRLIWSHVTLRVIQETNRSWSLSECTDFLVRLFKGDESLSLSRANISPKQTKLNARQNDNRKGLETSLYFMNRRRLVGESLEAEIQICLLEGVIHTGFYKRWLAEGQKSTIEPVRLTAGSVGR
jgi:hypothetical protein